MIGGQIILKDPHMNQNNKEKVGILFGLPVYKESWAPKGTICLHGIIGESEVIYHSSFEDDKTGKQYKYMINNSIAPSHISIADDEGNFERMWELYGHQGNVTKGSYPIRKECRDVAKIIEEIVDESKKL